MTLRPTARPGHIAPGRVVHDFVNLMDLAPTFCEAGGVAPPAAMTARSLLPVLESAASGQVALGSYPIVTFQYSPTTLYQVSYHIR
jgi:hypothetical protein